MTWSSLDAPPARVGAAARGRRGRRPAGRDQRRRSRASRTPCRSPRAHARPRRRRSRARGSQASTRTRSRRSRRAQRGNVIVTSGTASGKSLSFNLPCSTRSPPTRRRGRSTSTRPRRSRRTRRASSPSSACRELRQAIYDGDTPRDERPAIRRALEPGPHQPGHAPHGGPAPPPRWGDFLANLALRRRRRGPRLPRRLRLPRRQRAAAAAPGRRASTAPSRASSAPRRRSPTRSSSPSGSPGARSRSSTPTARPRAGRRIAIWNPPLTDPRSMPGARSSPRPRTCSPTWSSTGRGRSASCAAAAASS